VSDDRAQKAAGGVGAANNCVWNNADGAFEVDDCLRNDANGAGVAEDSA
jgi:hypothetical protein